MHPLIPVEVRGGRLDQPVLLPDRLLVLLNRFYLPEQGLPCGYPLIREVTVVANELQGVVQSTLGGLQTLQELGI